jgi:aspartate-semialdehyde dehydrogenase
MRKQAYSVAVAGATGAVGLEMIKTLERRKFPVGEVKLLASERSEGKELKFNGRTVRVEKLTKESFKGVEIALFSAGASRSLEFGPAAAASGAVVVVYQSKIQNQKSKMVRPAAQHLSHASVTGRRPGARRS